MSIFVSDLFSSLYSRCIRQLERQIQRTPARMTTTNNSSQLYFVAADCLRVLTSLCPDGVVSEVTTLMMGYCDADFEAWLYYAGVHFYRQLSLHRELLPTVAARVMGHILHIGRCPHLIASGTIDFAVKSFLRVFPRNMVPLFAEKLLEECNQKARTSKDIQGNESRSNGLVRNVRRRSNRKIF